MDGFLLVDKESGWTSHDVVAKARNITRIRKIGHAGTLDPMATGLLVLGVGRATRLLRFIQGAPKEYVAQAQLGVATDTLDADGAVLSREPMTVDDDDFRGAMERFRGPIMQVPPMVSARKVEGKRLYELAREGKEVEREARQITVYELELVEFAPSDYPVVTFRVVASTGTYVRTLADDMARALGGRAHLTELRRTRNGSISVEDAVPVGVLENEEDWSRHLLAPRNGLADLAEVTIGPDVVKAVSNGLAMPSAAIGATAHDGENVRVVEPGGRLLAVYKVSGQRAAPEVVLG